jgi:hypothetical protein
MSHDTYSHEVMVWEHHTDLYGTWVLYSTSTMVHTDHIIVVWFRQTIFTLRNGMGTPYQLVWYPGTICDVCYVSHRPYHHGRIQANHTLRNGMGTPYQLVWYPGTICDVCYGSHRPYHCGMVQANHTCTEEWYGYTIPTCMVPRYHIPRLL